ncbi:MAG TPA: serine/threonine-protein kinase [Polyangiaceae bacterium]|jgi:serine/threonine-protein kinase|nr:MAG: Serine/threonine-protein kinase PknB [Deltaproteobacteria bacterium ADurb.Bin207]HNS96920.1 serine/threonine-protein kinase [Polyangiaceae bacterium]HNZ21074.1 serine/threonine-protein kinase [Polyangiaceae bacterium]HOD22301.1 serine/threonine-protein kinase [Polyangiaceae bacterium]HOE47844.1 serine/threonine-protein kinase [Polyangiaceae bacterium]
MNDDTLPFSASLATANTMVARVCTTCGKTYPPSAVYCSIDGSELSAIATDDTDPLVGQVLDGRWVIRRRIGAGGMGAVYAASQLSVNRQVAIKTLPLEHSKNPGLVERFLHEAEVASTIAHPHCVTIHDFGQTREGLLYLAMEYLDGQSLEDRLQQAPISIPEVIEITNQVAAALTAAHAQRIVHRDLKPANIFLLSMPDHSVFVKVLDFGIAKALDSTRRLTGTGEVFGTPWYMSPEQSLGQAVDGRSDLYSLGCILYEMLTGRPPFDADNPMAILSAHIHTPVPPIDQTTQRSDIPPELARLCMRLLRKSPDERPPDAASARASLKSLGDTADRDVLPSLSTLAAASTAANSTTIVHDDKAKTQDSSSSASTTEKSLALPWILVLGLIGTIVGVGTIATLWTWLAQGSPDLLVP